MAQVIQKPHQTRNFETVCPKLQVDEIMAQKPADREEQLQTVLDNIPDIVWLKDENGVHLMVNDAFTKICNRPKESVVGCLDTDIWPHELAKKYMTDDRDIVRLGKQRKLEETVIDSDGKKRLVETIKTPIFDHNGKVIGTTGIARDISYRKQIEEKIKTLNKELENRVHFRASELMAANKALKNEIAERKETEKQLIQADKMISLGVLVSGVAHEINNPNNLIMLNTPILKEAWQSVLPILDAYYKENGDFNVGGLSYTEMRDVAPRLLEGILGGSKRIVRIVQELKDYARYEPGDVKELVDINKSVKNAVSLVSNQIKKVTKHFSVCYDEALPPLKGNRQKLEQVVINLLQNACQTLSNPNETISVRTYIDPKYDMVAVEVKDEGNGIPTSHLARIMDPFFTTKRDTGGTGLGLSVSSKIVQDHGGRISVQTKEGEGSVFTILLPTKVTREKVKVLVTDDDDLIRDLVTRVIQRQEHYLVTTASNGAEACLMLGSDAPHLLILDIKMPDMDGIEVCRQIQKTPSLLGVKVIIITGHHESYEAKVLAGMGFTNILPKPLSPQKLMNMIEEVMLDN